MSLRHQMTVRITAHASEPDMPLATKEAVYRIGLEALQNTIKHSRATRVDVTIAIEGGKLALEIKDNGCGFDTQADFTGHYGLKGMRERAAQVGATLLIDSRVHLGTRLVLTIPL
jgi:signal transduction histidine kinase